jgi:hypothetical protein
VTAFSPDPVIEHSLLLQLHVFRSTLHLTGSGPDWTPQGEPQTASGLSDQTVIWRLVASGHRCRLSQPTKRDHDHAMPAMLRIQSGRRPGLWRLWHAAAPALPCLRGRQPPYQEVLWRLWHSPIWLKLAKIEYVSGSRSVFSFTGPPRHRIWRRTPSAHCHVLRLGRLHGTVSSS